MNKGIAGDVFETLGGIVQGAGKQAVKQIKKMGKDAAEALGVKPPVTESLEKINPAAHNEDQYQKIDKAARERAAANYKQILAEIRQLQHKRKEEEQAYRAGPSGQKAETTVIKQLEVAEQPKAKLEKAPAEAEKEKLPPLPVKQASRKTEMFRGASG